MKEKFKKYIIEIMKYLVILTVILNIISYFKALDLNKDKLELRSFNLINEKIYKITGDNKPILIYFWATWCPTCKIVSSNINQLSKSYEVITIAVQSGSNKQIKSYLNSAKLSFNVVNDEEGFFSRKFNISAFPTILIYDKNKNLNFSEVGYTSTFGLYLRMWFSYIF